jgi:hypothetical protein
VPTVSEPPLTGVPLPTPGFDPDVGVPGDAAGLDEQPAKTLEAPAPRATAPPATALLDKKLRRLISLPEVTDTPPYYLPPTRY